VNRDICIPKEALEAFCRDRGIRRLAVFGSALRSDFRPDSDIDVLVEFEPDRIPGLLGMAHMERELSALLTAGRSICVPQKTSADIFAGRSSRRQRCSMQPDDLVRSAHLGGLVERHNA
jgi:predicted nucleotidyltransferase